MNIVKCQPKEYSILFLQLFNLELEPTSYINRSTTQNDNAYVDQILQFLSYGEHSR